MKQQQKNLFYSTLLLIAVFTIVTAATIITFAEEQEEERSQQLQQIILLDQFERRTGDTVLIEGEYFQLMHNYRYIEYELRDLENETKIYEQGTTGRALIELRTRYNTEITVQDPNGETILRKIIREPTAANIARYRYDLTRWDITLTSLLGFAWAGITVLGHFYDYDKREW